MKWLYPWLCSLIFFNVASIGSPLVISEFLARNDDGIIDEDGDPSDWIEIHNRSPLNVSLKGWSLTDNQSDPRKCYTLYFMNPIRETLAPDSFELR